MNFSEEWKSLWPITSASPLILHGPCAKPLGPLFFTPSPQTQTLLFSSPSLLSQPNQTDPISSNSLQTLRLPNKNAFLLFFPTGENSDRVGFLEVSTQGSKPEALLDKGGEIFAAKQQLSHRILQISVSSVVGFYDNSDTIIGFLSVLTMYAVHFYRVEISLPGSVLEKPFLAYLGSKQFTHIVKHVSWNPHLPEESLVLLENGGLYLFDSGDCTKVVVYPTKLKGTKISFPMKDLDLGLEEVRWLSCGFSWHPRMFIVCCCFAVFLVDWRFEEVNVSSLAKLDLFPLTHSVGKDRFIAFSMAGSDGFHFTVASCNHLFLLDIRKPNMPLLQWTHGLDNPCYVNVLNLSELRSTMEVDNYRWATDSGFVILLGSFLSGDFNLFFYGPPLPQPYNSVASKVLDFTGSFYAWEISSELFLLNGKCCCGDCLLREEFSSTKLPPSRKKRVFGFCILSEDLFSPQSETDGFCGFTLIRLVSSGRLESLKYRASWDLLSREQKESREEDEGQSEDYLPYLFHDQGYKFPRRFRYLRLDYLLAYMNGDLSKVVFSKMQNLRLNPGKTISFTPHGCKLVCDMLKASGVDNIGSPPAIAEVFNKISWPMSIYEVSSSRIWAGLTADLLQLAFTSCSELRDILVDHRKINVDFADIPDAPQVPPFFEKKPSSRSNRLSRKPGNAIVGPLLPLPLLLTLREVVPENLSVLEDEASKFSAETELNDQCIVVMGAADMASSESWPGLDDSCTVSLANDGEEKWVGSQEPMSIFFHKPSAISGKKSSKTGLLQEPAIYKDEKHDTFISKRREKTSASNPMKEPVGIEIFNELCPIELNFDFPPMKFEGNELKGYRLLYGQFSKWQENFKPYQDFCKASKI